MKKDQELGGELQGEVPGPVEKEPLEVEKKPPANLLDLNSENATEDAAWQEEQ
eukprot:CAMPEP_0185758060 /NCGR_PEP_ID=MMETSP1174-20130828/16613_1 /TAXON_ID=35687 /ORGANISM="Dictyocha speculum, Strain CCMP1381" /LENGTH=52 /DNA_ID=CAMNT_0028437723 /DNA_START=39 /DNA_END=194 /DNA_ORIENTATION=+